MSFFRGLLAALVVAPVVFVDVWAAEPLTLDAAFARVASNHPDFAVARSERALLEARRARAALNPELRAELEVENVLGTGALAATKSAEVSLSLASLIERGDKRSARVELASRRIDASATLRAGRRLDLMAEVARRYLDVVVADNEAVLAAEDIVQRAEALEAARQRVAAGGAPASVRLMAEAALRRAEGRRARALDSALAAKRRLALMWGERTPAGFDVARMDLTRLPDLVEFDVLRAQLTEHPDLQVFAHEARIREAKLRLARSAAVRDIEWQIGLRRNESSDDWALIGSLSVPLGKARRAAPEIDAAQAQLDAMAFEREAVALDLESTLAEAHAQFSAAQADIARIDREVLPILHAAETEAAKAYRRGAISFLEWAQLQNDRVETRRERLAAAVIAHRALIEIQRLAEVTAFDPETNGETSP